MSAGRRPLPADMLLVEERRKRLAGGGRAEGTALDAGAAEELLIEGDDRLVGDDELLPDPAFGASAPEQSPEPGDLVLRRPAASVSLVQVAWGGPVDHDALARAIACHPIEPDAAGFFHRTIGPALFAVAQPGAALEVTLRRADRALLERLAATAPGRMLPLVWAACLPARLSGVDVQTGSAVSGVLHAYRYAALRHAWHARSTGRDSVRFDRERDEAAVSLLSTLRALLGER